MTSERKVRFCWICSTKLWGNHSEELTVDGHSRTLHKDCAKEIKKQREFVKREDGYHSMMWNINGSYED